MSVWYQIVVQGPERSVRAFVSGFAAGRGAGEEAVLGADLDLDPHSLGERLHELFAGGAHHVVLAPEGLARPLVAALAARGPALDVRLERHDALAAASFPLRIEVFARELVEERRRALLAAPPAGVRVEDLEVHEEVHPEVHGPELYAPLHPFAWRASARITGELPGVLELRRRAAELDFVEVGALRLETGSGAR